MSTICTVCFVTHLAAVLLSTLLDIIAAGHGQSAAQAVKGPPLRLPEFVLKLILALFTVLNLFRFLSLFPIQFSVLDKS